MYGGVDPLQLFTCDTGNKTEWYISLRITGECYQDQEFYVFYEGAKPPGQTGIINSDNCVGDNSDGYIIASALDEITLALNQYLPRSEHHGFLVIDYRLALRSPCSAASPSCICQGSNYMNGFVAEGTFEHYLGAGTGNTVFLSMSDFLHYPDCSTCNP